MGYCAGRGGVRGCIPPQGHPTCLRVARRRGERRGADSCAALRHGARPRRKARRKVRQVGAGADDATGRGSEGCAAVRCPHAASPPRIGAPEAAHGRRDDGGAREGDVDAREVRPAALHEPRPRVAAARERERRRVDCRREGRRLEAAAALGGSGNSGGGGRRGLPRQQRRSGGRGACSVQPCFAEQRSGAPPAVPCPCQAAAARDREPSERGCCPHSPCALVVACRPRQPQRPAEGERARGTRDHRGEDGCRDVDNGDAGGEGRRAAVGQLRQRQQRRRRVGCARREGGLRWGAGRQQESAGAGRAGLAKRGS